MLYETIKLTAPAGNMEKLKVAISNGADKVFLGGKILNMRAGTKNFSDEELKEAVEYAHKFGKEVHVTLNAVPHNQDIDLLPEYAEFLESIGVDGVIVSDLGVFECIKTCTNLPITVNTHSSNTNWRSVKMWSDLGATTVIIDRDISLASIADIRFKVPEVKLELLVHGPLNMAISARPILSNYMDIKDIDSDSLRDDITITEETRPGEDMPIFEDKYGTYIYSAKDLCTLDIIEHLLIIGVDSIKIDGGMKDENYLSTVVSVYRDVLDTYATNNFVQKEEWIEKLRTTTNIPFIDWYVKPERNI